MLPPRGWTAQRRTSSIVPLLLVAHAGLAASTAPAAIAAVISGEGRISGAQSTARTAADVTVNVADSDEVVAAANNFATGGKQAMLYSGDAGATWGQSYLPGVGNDWSHNEAGLDWDADGTAWVATSATELKHFPLPHVFRIHVYKSTDGGASWQYAGTPSEAQEDAVQPSLRVDHGASSSFADSIHVLWGRSSGSGVYSSVRPSGGSWSSPLRIDGAETTGVAAASDVETNDDGDVFAFWRDVGSASSRKLLMAKSVDGGVSFGPPSTIALGFTGSTGSVPASLGVGVRFSGGAYRSSLPDPDVDDVYAAWIDLTGTAGCSTQADWPSSNPGSTCKTRVWFSRSTDGGATWEPAKMLANSPDLNDQFDLRLAVDAATGTLAVVYRDTIADPTRRQSDIWYQSSHDRGSTWSAPVKVTSAPTDETGSGATFGYGRVGLAGHYGVFHATWTDRRNGGLEEVWSARIDDPACTAPGASAIGSATAGVNQVQLTWGNGSPAAESFDIYRAVGTCAAPGSFTRIATGLGSDGSPYDDTGLSGGVTYAYRVTGRDATGVCESAASACVEATPTGTCSLPPAFAGLGTVTSPGSSLCTIHLAWAAATAYCGGPVTYDVHRSTTAGFTPSPANRIATGVIGTSYDDVSPLHQGGTYHYLVRAVDGATNIADANVVRRTTTPFGPFADGLPGVDTFEGTESGGGFDYDGWEHAIESGPLDWVWTSGRAQSGAHSWHSPSQGSTASPVGRLLDSPPFTAEVGTRLTFWHTFSFRDASVCSDGGALEVSTDGGTNWSALPSSALEVGGYNGTRPISGEPAWCGGALGLPTLVMADLSAYPGPETRVRWHASQTQSGLTGWYVDSVAVGELCHAAPSPAMDFYTTTPCRLIDTRGPSGPWGAPALQPQGQRTFALNPACGIPTSAKALSVNVTVTQPTAAGSVKLYAADLPVAPMPTVVPFGAGQTRGNNAILTLAGDGSGGIMVRSELAGTTHFILDVNGWFE